MKKLFLSVVALFMPWLAFLLNDCPGEALLALLLQATLIGWPFATLWALRVIHSSSRKIKKEA